MKLLVIEVLAHCVGKHFMEESIIKVELYGEKKVELQLLNTTEAIGTDEEDVLSWASFLPEWTTSESAVSLLEQLWNRSLGENLTWFYSENFREVAAHLMKYLVDCCSGVIKVSVTPDYMHVSFRK